MLNRAPAWGSDDDVADILQGIAGPWLESIVMRVT